MAGKFLHEEIYRGAETLAKLAEPRVAICGAGALGSHLADNLAGAVIAEEGKVTEAEAGRVLHPGGLALLGEKQIVKPVPEGVDDWSHPYHGPDNNPQSTDQLALAPYLTPFGESHTP